VAGGGDKTLTIVRVGGGIDVSNRVKLGGAGGGGGAVGRSG